MHTNFDHAASKKREQKRKDEVRKNSKETQERESASLTDARQESISQQLHEDQSVELEVMNIYTRLLHQKVYALMEDLVDTLCKLMDELNQEDEWDTCTDTHTLAYMTGRQR
ncbi:hypothetical protein PAMP_020786 [Pampus punctatissimus]